MIEKRLKHFAREVLGRVLYLLHRKKAVYIMSAQRSGSTLLKALLANEPSISHLPEISPNPYALHKFSSQYYFHRLAKQQIIVFKIPRSPRVAQYPVIGAGIDYYIYLFRNPVDVALSMLSSQREVNQIGMLPPFEDLREATDGQILDRSLRYWLETNKMISAAVAANSAMKIKYISYESLVAQPEENLRSLLAFIGIQASGSFTTYNAYDDKNGWQWGRDDGGNLIRLKKVVTRQQTQLSDETRLRYEIDKDLFEECRVYYEDLYRHRLM